MSEREGQAAGVELFMAFCPRGIPPASASGGGRERRLRPGRAMCDVFSLDVESGDWTFLEEALVFDDYPGFDVADGAWIQVLRDSRGAYRTLGEEIGEGLSKGV